MGFHVIHRVAYVFYQLWINEVIFHFLVFLPVLSLNKNNYIFILKFYGQGISCLTKIQKYCFFFQYVFSSSMFIFKWLWRNPFAWLIRCHGKIKYYPDCIIWSDLFNYGIYMMMKILHYSEQYALNCKQHQTTYFVYFLL